MYKHVVNSVLLTTGHEGKKGSYYTVFPSPVVSLVSDFSTSFMTFLRASPTKVTALPPQPALAVRPTRWTYLCVCICVCSKYRMTLKVRISKLGSLNCTCTDSFNTQFTALLFLSALIACMYCKNSSVSVTYVLALLGISAFITVCTPGISKPLAATSVQTCHRKRKDRRCLEYTS